jgi:uncharacterized protein YecE (DUF72 family)
MSSLPAPEPLLPLAASIRTGIGGWTYPGWRGGVFYPPGLRPAEELAFAARQVAAIEINATYHRLQTPASFAAWRAATPEGFVFTLKGSRFVTNRKELASAEPALARFLGQGFIELGDRLGPIVWQLMATKRFDPDDVAAFLAMLPAAHEGLPLRHAVEVGHETFACAEFVALARRANVAVCFSDMAGRVAIADRTAGFAYARLQRMEPELPTGYPPERLGEFAALARAWSRGEAPQSWPYAGERSLGCIPGDVFLFFINGAKERAPAAAKALAALI